MIVTRTESDLERLILWRFTDAQIAHLRFIRWAYLHGRLGSRAWRDGQNRPRLLQQKGLS